MAFKLKSGNKTSFRNMGSSPLEQKNPKNKNTDFATKFGLKEIDPAEVQHLKRDQFSDQGSDFMYQSPDGHKMYGYDDDGMYITAPDGRAYTGTREMPNAVYGDDGMPNEVEVTLDGRTYNTHDNFDVIASKLGAEFNEGYHIKTNASNTKDLLRLLGR